MTVLLAACSSGGSTSASTSGSTSETTSAMSPAASPTSALPPITTLKSARAHLIEAKPFPDWVLIAFGKVWVAGVGKGIGVLDPGTTDRIATFPVPEQQCAAMDAGFGAVWTATCERRGIDRIDPPTYEILAHVDAEVPREGESSIGVGEGGVWAITSTRECGGCVLIRIDPATNEIVDRYDVPGGGSAVRAGLGGVWITYSSSDQLVHVDPDTGKVLATIDLPLGPRFLDVGENGVWVMNQFDGSVSHVDPRTDSVVSTIGVDPYGIEGGDLTVGEGYVWLRATDELVAQIDPAGDAVVAHR
jgi:streptogramin lyase